MIYFFQASFYLVNEGRVSNKDHVHLQLVMEFIQHLARSLRSARTVQLPAGKYVVWNQLYYLSLKPKARVLAQVYRTLCFNITFLA